ncbi:zinc finger protein 628-like [Schistocerca piceifrons]|uniref:zinc finger protein 628-like n=1 Tax=Schistocerca piceifrons TaxID=274613 RepID=UPI001F5F8676|nr:zinc finger protein 628-like [Schistocerca piceifrons]
MDCGVVAAPAVAEMVVLAWAVTELGVVASLLVCTLLTVGGCMQGEGSGAPPTWQPVQEEDSLRLKRLLGIGLADKAMCPKTNINSSSRTSSGQRCEPKALTSPQTLQQRQCVDAVQHKPPPPPPLSVSPHQIRHPTRAIPPLLPSPPLPTPPSHPVSPSKLPTHFQELQQPQPPLLQPPRPRQQQPPDVPETSLKPEELPANRTLVSAAATGLQTKHKCEDCGKFFGTKTALKMHARTHTGEKPYQCAECGKLFSQLRNYKYHVSVHAGTHEFAAACPECGKVFNNRGYLSTHMKIHRNRKEYACADCGRRFNQRVAYTTHVRIHTGEPPYVCTVCDKTFTRSILLKQHMRTHTGEKPFTCEVCGKQFADRSNMMLHLRLHSGIRPYSCGECGKAFTKKHHLKAHMSCHTGLRPHACDRCGARFSQVSNMRTHRSKCTALGPPRGGGGNGGGEGGEPAVRAAVTSVIMRVSGELVQHVLQRTDVVAAASGRNVTLAGDSASSLGAPWAMHTA